MAHLHGIADRNLIIGAAVGQVRKLRPEEASDFGWSKRPAMLFLTNGTVLVPVRDMDGDEGGILWNHVPRLWPRPSFSRIWSGRAAEGGWLRGLRIRDLRPLGRRELGRFGWRGESPVSGLFMDDGGILLPCRGDFVEDGPGEFLALRLGRHMLVLPEGPKDWAPR